MLGAETYTAKFSVGYVEWDESASNISTVKNYAFGDKEITEILAKLVNPTAFPISAYEHRLYSLSEEEYDSIKDSDDFMLSLMSTYNDVNHRIDRFDIPGMRVSYDETIGQFSIRWNEDDVAFIKDRSLIGTFYYIHLVTELGLNPNRFGYKV